MKHRFVLEPYKGRDTRHTCLKCQAKGKTFVRYIDTQTGEHIAPIVGKCNRLDKCGYHYPPKDYFQDNNFSPSPALPGKPSQPRIEKPRHISFFPFESFKESLQCYEENNFVKYLKGSFGEIKTKELIEKYFIGTSKHWKGSTVFYQIDISGKIRTGKIMLYNATTGRRVKGAFNYITWTHKALNMPGFNLKQCLFGEHLLKGSTKLIALVESEKTAIIASVYFPQFTWLATGGKGNLSLGQCQALRSKTVIVFPDLKGFDDWQTKAIDLSHFANFLVSDFLETRATDPERKAGLDLADFLLRYDPNTFTKNQSEPENGFVND